MVDHNEIFNTGYVEGDGGVSYMGASLTNGYGMQIRENFVHHSLEVVQKTALMNHFLCCFLHY